MRITCERRAAPRKEVNLAVLCKSGVERGAGRIVNVSLSGALLGSASIRPERGTVVKILFVPPSGRASSELTGTVVRHTETGFAIQFLAINNALVELVGELA